MGNKKYACVRMCEHLGVLWEMNPARLLGRKKGNKMSETGEVRVNRDMSLRAQFHRMPPKMHHRDHAASEVLAHIREVLGCDLDRAVKAFNSMRNHRSGVLVFDNVDKTWHGCFWTPSEKEARDRKIWREIMELRRDLAALKSEIRKLRKKVLGAVREAKKEAKEAGDEESGQPSAVAGYPQIPQQSNPGDFAREFSRQMQQVEAEAEEKRRLAKLRELQKITPRMWQGCCDGCGRNELVGDEAPWTCAVCDLQYTARYDE